MRTTMQNDLQIFIIWSNALHIKQQIIDDLKQHFEIKKVFNCHWPKEVFAWYLVNFYHKNLYHCCKKEQECGNGDFLLIVVEDTNSTYQNAINIKMKQLKQKYRNWAKGSFLIHASDNPKEAEENLRYLTNMSIEEFYHKYPHSWDNQTEDIPTPKLTINKKSLFWLKICQTLRKLI